jgi:outer membrane protein OmpA-like peptidoglycan-associated protein
MMWTLTAGITYRLGRVGWSPAVDPNVLQAAYGGVIAGLEADLLEARNSNDMARKEISSLNRKLAEMNAECRDMQVKEGVMEKEMHAVVGFQQSVFFPFGSSALDSKKEQLNIEAFAKAAAAAGVKLKVIGFTDTTGPGKYNDELSKQRAEAVAEMLRAAGATVETVIGQGESSEYKTMCLNRRAIIEVAK